MSFYITLKFCINLFSVNLVYLTLFIKLYTQILISSFFCISTVFFWVVILTLFLFMEWVTMQKYENIVCSMHLIYGCWWDPHKDSTFFNWAKNRFGCKAVMIDRVEWLNDIIKTCGRNFKKSTWISMDKRSKETHEFCSINTPTECCSFKEVFD